MKVNTDGVLLGALASHQSPSRILDIGTGTGVIALMLAQRFANVFIDAIEIDELAAKTASLNAEKSIFANRIKVEHIAFQDFETAEQYDLIVSNPPFFVNDLKNEEHRKGIARHADVDFFEMLIEKSAHLLTESGKLWLILPVKQANEIISKASTFNLSLCDRINLHSDKSKATFRQIICLSKEVLPLNETDFYIYESLKENTAEYKLLLKDFFLAF
ncbi:tRNA1(Val) (adenine(37)-N6)-methyltransferase [Pedobacter punctiformis]|uniref:tRNA1(Val) (adenine(37)-N6)-methyltransferase n=1 Tax=Pedobacter punctiformis TaxID=3004097 RepID=A0ABT4L8G7_9SPHI|nr:methyltransferase [Pedobacter sp. HCMS5-2]MCZ4244195.1 methyltransferase [Pedobacter sp. HCMS5-2]